MKFIREIYLLILISCCGSLLAQTLPDGVCDSVKIHFRQSRIELLPDFKDNRASLDRIADSLQIGRADSIYTLKRILVVGGASPEGSVKFNRWLSENRARVLFDYLSRYGELPDSLKTTIFLGRDWNGLIRLAEADPDLPYRDQTLQLLRDIVEGVGNGTLQEDVPLNMLKRLRGGVPYNYMYRRHFPALRASCVHLWYEKTWNPMVPRKIDIPPPEPTIPTLVINVVPPMIDVEIPRPSLPKPFYMDLRTNLLYDVLAVPNIGVEFYLGKDWSVVGNWMYAWWHTDRRHRYWRIYGGDIALRRWFGKAAKEKPLTGHHIGLYAGLVTYDFEWGGKGIMGGIPRGTLWDRCNHMAGIEYGYSLPIARRLNIDFTIGVGYLGGEYQEYIPDDDCYVWQATKKRHYFGPTKIEVSLVRLIGRENYNVRKGGGK